MFLHERPMKRLLILVDTWTDNDTNTGVLYHWLWLYFHENYATCQFLAFHMEYLMLLNLPDTQLTVYSSFPFQLEKAHKDGYSLICLYSSQSDSDALHINVPESTMGCGSLEKRHFYSIRTLLGLFFIKCKWFFLFYFLLGNFYAVGSCAGAFQPPCLEKQCLQNWFFLLRTGGHILFNGKPFE